MDNQRHKACVVPRCNNTTKAPDKVFFEVPTQTQNNLREQWKEAIGGFQRPVSMESKNMYCCEDHFDMQKDTANFIEYQTSDTVNNQSLIQLQLKHGVVPHRFECQKRTTNSVETVPKECNKISCSCCSDITQPQCDNIGTALACGTELHDTNISNKDKTHDDIEQTKSNESTKNRRLILICKPVKIILDDLKYAVDPKISSLENTLNSLRTRGKNIDPIINTMALNGSTNGKRKQENCIDSCSRKRRKLIPKVLLWEREQTQCILIHDLQTRELDIYFLNSDLHITTYQRFSNVDSRTNPYVAEFKGRKNGLRVGQCCCWFCRENFIKILGKCMRASIKFTRKPHECKIYNCSCCCSNMPKLSRDEPIKLVSSIDTPFVWFKKLKAYYQSLHPLFPFTAIGRALIDVPEVKVENPIEDEMYKSMKIKLGNEYYEINLDGNLAFYHNGDQTEQPVQRPDITESICCWYKREQFAENLLKDKVRSSTVKFIRTPHLCPMQCKCCCRPKTVRKHMIPRTPKFARMITNHTTDVGNKNMKIKVKFPIIVRSNSQATSNDTLNYYPECNLGMAKTSMFSMPVVTENLTSWSSTKLKEIRTMSGNALNTSNLTSEKATMTNVSNKSTRESIASSSVKLTNIDINTTERNCMPAIVNILPRTSVIASATTTKVPILVPAAARTSPDISTIQKASIPVTVINNAITTFTGSCQGNLSSDIRNMPKVGIPATPHILITKPIASAAPTVKPTVPAPKFVIVPAFANPSNKGAVLTAQSNSCAVEPVTAPSVVNIESPKKTSSSTYSHTIKIVPATTAAKLFTPKSTVHDVKKPTPLSVSTSCQKGGAFSKPFIHKARTFSKVDEKSNAAVAASSSVNEPVTTLPSIVANINPRVTTVTSFSGIDDVIKHKVELDPSPAKSPTLETLENLKNISFIKKTGGKLSAQLGTSLSNLSTHELKILNSIFIMVENQLKAAGLEQSNLKLDFTDILDKVTLGDMHKSKNDAVCPPPPHNSNDLATSSNDKHIPLPTLPSYKEKRYVNTFIAVSGNQNETNNTSSLNAQTNVPENGARSNKHNLENSKNSENMVRTYSRLEHKAKGKTKTSPPVTNSKSTSTQGSANVSIRTVGGSILIDGSATTSDSNV